MTSKLLYSGPSIENLHNEYAKKSLIDRRAGREVTYEVEIAAPVTQVWQILSDPLQWNDVLPAIHDVHLDSDVAVDATFTWKNGSAKMKSRFAVVQPEKELTWTGTSIGFKAIHQHLLRVSPGGGTYLRQNESMAGPLLTMVLPRAKLQAMVKSWIDAIKTLAEERQNSSVLR